MKKQLTMLAMATAMCVSCNNDKEPMSSFNYNDEKFADIEMLRYEVKGFEELSLEQKKLVYYLQEAALYGRDILFDQNGRHNLVIRKMLETVYTDYQGDKTTEDWANFATYVKRVWFSSGIHHHYSADKFQPGFSEEFFREALASVDASKLPIAQGQTLADLCNEVFPVIFDPNVMPKRVNQADGQDLVLTSASFYYDGVTQTEAETFYNNLKDPKDETPVMYGMNSRLVKENGKIVEKIWHTEGLYGEALTKVVFWLEKALSVAENDQQKTVIEKLIK